MAIPSGMQQRRSALDDSKPIWRTMLVFLVPVMLSNILQSASATFNSIYLGRLIGVQAFAIAQIGLRLGARLSERYREAAAKLAGLALLGLAILLLVERSA